MTLVEMIQDAANGTNLDGWDAGPWLASWLERGSLVDWHGLDPAHLLMIATIKRCHELADHTFDEALRSMQEQLSPIGICSPEELAAPTTGIGYGCRTPEVRKAWAEVQLAIWEYLAYGCPHIQNIPRTYDLMTGRP